MVDRQQHDATAPAITHIGGPTVLVEFGGWRILTDPTFEPPGRRYAFGWGTASTKTAGPAIAVDELGRIDAVLLTHDHHADNLDDAGRALLPDVPVVVTTRAGARRLGERAVGLDDWESAERPHRLTGDRLGDVGRGCLRSGRWGNTITLVTASASRSTTRWR